MCHAIKRRYICDTFVLRYVMQLRRRNMNRFAIRGYTVTLKQTVFRYQILLTG
jgi:hypothetical protein